MKSEDFIAARHAGGVWHGLVIGDSWHAACGYPVTGRQPIADRNHVDCPDCLDLLEPQERVKR